MNLMQAYTWYGEANTVGEHFKFSRKYEDLEPDRNDKSCKNVQTTYTKCEEAKSWAAPIAKRALNKYFMLNGNVIIAS